MKRLIVLGSVFSLLVVGSLLSPTTPESRAQVQRTEFQYAAKFVCGRSNGPLAAPGQYFTIINVHNPSPNRTVKFKKKFALGERAEKVGKIYGFFEAALRADEVMGMDCPDIYQHTGIPPGTFIEGYAVLHTPAELDVVSVFTAGGDRVETLHTERVPPRKVPVVVTASCPDFKMGINTGTANWRVTADPDGSTIEPRAANLISGPSVWGAITAAQWIGSTVNDGSNAKAGDYTYELSFCLCRGFSNPKISLTGLADNRANVSLNGPPLSPSIGGFAPADLTSISAVSPFVVGNNVLKVVVKNDGGPQGLIIGGGISATAGKCPGGVVGETGGDVNPN